MLLFTMTLLSCSSGSLNDRYPVSGETPNWQHCDVTWQCLAGGVWPMHKLSHYLQVGVTAMLIASKYEDIWAPEVRDFVYISDQAYSADQILEMEKIMLNALRFSLTVPTSLNFLNRFCKVGLAVDDKQAQHFATYLVELSLVDYACLKYSYSMVAASAVFCARLMLDRQPVLPPVSPRLHTFVNFHLRHARPHAFDAQLARHVVRARQARP